MLTRTFCLFFLVHLAIGLELKAQLKDQWKSFKKAHLKSYNPSEEDMRKEVFKQSVEAVLQHNLKADLGEETYRLSINQFADMTDEEIVQNLMGVSHEPVENSEDVDYFVPESRADYPEKVDWRESGFATTPKDQKSCGSCWAFATTAVVETHYGLATGEHVTLSEQMLLDCAINGGCKKGGTVIGGFYYLMGKGINHDRCYEYVAEKSESCKFNSTCVALKISNHKAIRKGDEAAILAAVATKGPVAVHMYANPRQMSLYKSGIYNPESCSDPFNHAVVIFGYGTENDQPYWLVRNSWGGKWGDEGYFKLPRNVNKCHIANEGRYPVI